METLHNMDVLTFTLPNNCADDFITKLEDYCCDIVSIEKGIFYTTVRYRVNLTKFKNYKIMLDLKLQMDKILKDIEKERLSIKRVPI